MRIRKISSLQDDEDRRDTNIAGLVMGVILSLVIEYAILSFHYNEESVTEILKHFGAKHYCISILLIVAGTLLFSWVFNHVFIEEDHYIFTDEKK